MSRLWACPDDQELSRLALDPARAGSRELLEHVEHCELCRFVLNEKRREAQELARVWESTAGPTVIVMKRFRPDSESVSQGMVLAAKGVGGVKDEEAVTLVSEGQQYIMRVVRDAGSGDLWLYLLSDEPGGASRVVVSPFGGEATFVTDERGRVNLGARAWPGEGELVAEVRHPLAQFRLSPLKDIEAAAGSTTVLTSERGDRIQVTLSGSEHGRRLSVVLLEAPGLGLGAGKSLRLGIRESGTGSLKVEPLAGAGTASVEVGAAPEFEIYLFA